MHFKLLVAWCGCATTLLHPCCNLS